MSCNRIYPFDYCCDDSSVESESNNVEANPANEATEILNKLKVGETTYSTTQHGLTLTGTHISEDKEDELTIGSLTISDEDYNSVINGEIDYIQATGGRNEDICGWYIGKKDGVSQFVGIQCIPGSPQIVRYFNLLFSEELTSEVGSKAAYTIQDFPTLPFTPSDSHIKSYVIKTNNFGVASWVEGIVPPPLPSDTSKTYTLKSVNGVLTWVDTSVDTQKFKNVEVSGYLNVTGSIATPRGFVYPLKQEDFICNASDLTHNSGDLRISMSESASASFTTFFNNSGRDKWLLRARINIGFSTGNPISIAVTPNLDTALTRKGFEGSFVTKANGVVSFAAIVDNDPGCYFYCSDHTIIDTYFSYISRIIVEITYADITEA